MRTFYLLLFAALFSMHLLVAQSVSIGFVTGLGAAAHQQVFEKDYGGYYVRPVLAKSIGIAMTYDFSAHLAFESGLYYEEKGNHPYGFKNRYDYLTVPATLKWKILGQRRIAPYLRSGVYYARLVGDEHLYIPHSTISDVFPLEYQTPKRIDFGIAAAFGADWRLSPQLRLNVDFSGSRGLLPLYNNYSGLSAYALASFYQLYNVGCLFSTGVYYSW